MHLAKFAIGFLLWLLAVFRADGAVLLSEIMFDPSGDEATDEFVELYNNSALPANLAGWMISDGESTDTLLDAGMGLLAVPNQYVLILDPDYISEQSTIYDSVVSEDALVVTITSTSFGRLGLSNSESEPVRLMNSAGVVVAEYAYIVGNESGHSEEKVRFSMGDEPGNWADSEVLLGTPGFRNSVTPPDRDLALLTCAPTPSFPAIGEPFDLRVVLTNRGAATLSNRARLSVDHAGGVEWSVIDSQSTAAIAPADTVELTWQLALSASGMARCLIELSESDDDTTNNRIERLVASSAVNNGLEINEIQAAPLAGRSEWIELAVSGLSPVALAGVSFSDGQGLADTSERHQLPDIVLAPDEYLVLAMDSTIFTEQIPATATIHVIAENAPTLNNSGDSLVLYGPNGDVLERVDYRENWGSGSSGASLERISLSANANDQANWESSVDAQLATPGRMNSRSITAPRRSTTLTVFPSPFTPNDDGRDEFTEIHYSLENPASKIDILVFDARGREVRRLAGGQDGLSEGALIWDGRGDNGVLLPTARYIVVLEAENASGGVSRERTTVVLARPK